MKRSKKLIIAVLIVILIGLLSIIAGTLLGGPDLVKEDKNVLVLASDKGEQQNGAVDMAFMVHLKDGAIDKPPPSKKENGKRKDDLSRRPPPCRDALPRRG